MRPSHRGHEKENEQFVRNNYLEISKDSRSLSSHLISAHLVSSHLIMAAINGDSADNASQRYEQSVHITVTTALLS